eukprot:CAMPEP_0198703370 /NCGR_PEP_ID=MMETSP1468-20131203/389307_1 /TAXON_ID=1461545 /ORGANISM="Mantoniella sp, Strain CCMP1436" /LENGTH=401 /DNA_ID=CAMNT_0044462059 /DNA_START=1157 /DNA_END=2361 /DNA_ORIENTATION=-
MYDRKDIFQLRHSYEQAATPARLREGIPFKLPKGAEIRMGGKTGKRSNNRLTYQSKPLVDLISHIFVFVLLLVVLLLVLIVIISPTIFPQRQFIQQAFDGHFGHVVVIVVVVAAAAAAAAAAAPKSKPKPKPTTKPTPEKRPPQMVWRVSNPTPPPRARRWDTDVDGPALRVVSWNVNGIRALLDKDPRVLDRLAEEECADVVVLQETKIQEKHVADVDARVLAAYPHRLWNCSTTRLGYSGTALFSRIQPLALWSDPFTASSPQGGEHDGDEHSSQEFAGEGRVVVAEFPGCFVVGAYVPNSGGNLARLHARTQGWDPAAARYLGQLQARGKPVVFCGDLNVAHQPLDLWGNHAANEKGAGYTPEERNSFQRLLLAPPNDTEAETKVGGGGGGGGGGEVG